MLTEEYERVRTNLMRNEAIRLIGEAGLVSMDGRTRIQCGKNGIIVVFGDFVWHLPVNKVLSMVKEKVGDSTVLRMYVDDMGEIIVKIRC